MIDCAATFVVAVIFGVLSFRYLRLALYSPSVSVICAVLVVSQILVALMTATMMSLLLAVAVFPIVVGAAAFAQTQNVRNVMLLSGSLAIVQAVNPLGTAMAGIVVPVLIGMQDTKFLRSRGISLLVLLLFIPTGAAIFLTYRAYTMDTGMAVRLAHNVAQFATHKPGFAFSDFRVQALARAAELAAIALPVWIGAAVVRSRASVAIATVCAALIVAVTVAAFFGRPRPVALVAPAMAMPSIVALREWPRSRRTVPWTVLMPGLSVLLTWLCAELAA